MDSKYLNFKYIRLGLQNVHFTSKGTDTKLKIVQFKVKVKLFEGTVAHEKSLPRLLIESGFCNCALLNILVGFIKVTFKERPDHVRQ